MLTTLLAFLLAIGILVTVHEYGHYRVARACGVKVLTFSIGFGPVLCKWQRGETQWQLALFPFGGFVRMLGEEEGGEQKLSAEEEKRAFHRQTPWRKMAIVAAGPLANLLLAWLLFSMALGMGADALQPVVGGVRVGSLAEQAGVRAEDRILRFGDQDILQWDDLRVAALAVAGQAEVSLQVQRPGQGERMLQLDLSGPDGRVMDLEGLERIGLSPLPLLAVVGRLEPGGVAEQAGLQKGDAIVAINEQSISRWEVLQHTIARSGGQPLLVTIERNGQRLTLNLTPKAVATAQGEVGRIGISPQIDQVRWKAQRMELRLSFLDALAHGAAEMQRLTWLTIKFSVAMLSGEMSSKNVSGPVGIASMAGETASLGAAPYIKYLGLLSLSLGILNLLPIPVLDGGHLLYHVLELVRGRPVSSAWQEIGQRIGIGLLIALMMLAFYNDINRLITG